VRWPERTAPACRRPLVASIAGPSLFALPACGGPGDGVEHPVLELTICQAAFSDMSAARAGAAAPRTSGWALLRSSPTHESFTMEEASEWTLEETPELDYPHTVPLP